MISLVERRKCTGCMACEQICPKNCIKQKKDNLGNVYPDINRNDCIECGKCMSVCPELNRKKEFKNIKKAYAVWSLNSDSRFSSASGGAAAEFYTTALEEDYWICGAEYIDKFHVVHTLSKDAANIERYKQSKYVFSELNDMYKSIKQKLNDKEKILFISLPCKVAGLLSYLGKTYENLITVDIVCHGTPSYQQLWEHILAVDKTGKAAKLRLRYENEFAFQLTSKNDKEVYIKVGRQDTYLAAFLEGLSYRLSCYECTYAKSERISDISICDFWGLGVEISFDHPYSGAVSAVLINSKQGECFFEKCKGRMFVEERPVWEAVKGNAQLNHPTPMHTKRRQFEEEYLNRGFEDAVKICLKEEIEKDKVLLWKREIRRNLRKAVGIFIPRYRS